MDGGGGGEETEGERAHDRDRVNNVCHDWTVLSTLIEGLSI